MATPGHRHEHCIVAILVADMAGCGSTQVPMSRMSRQKTKRRRTVKLPRRKAIAPTSRTLDKKKTALLTRELSEAVEREKATSQVLGIISTSPTDLEPVFETILANATRLCEASYGTLWLCDGDATRLAALHGAVPAVFSAERQRGAMFRLGAGAPSTRAVRTRQTVHVTDMRMEQTYLDRDPRVVSGVELGGVRTLVAVPMLKENQVVGLINIYRTEVRPFTDRQIALVTNFASQALIAVENARLLNELRASLEQQTATADVLKVISRSTFDLQVVLDTLVESAAKLCQAERAALIRPKGGSYQLGASYRYTEEYKESLAGEHWEPGRRSLTGRVLLEGKIIHIPDVEADPDFTFPKLGSRTMLGVPLLRQETLVGVFVLTRTVVQPFNANRLSSSLPSPIKP
jgi:two-component system, NtrC family, sensor kinase